MHYILAVDLVDFAIPLGTGIGGAAASYAYASYKAQDRGPTEPIAAAATRDTLSVRPTQALHVFAPVGADVMISVRCADCGPQPLRLVRSIDGKIEVGVFKKLVVPPVYDYETVARFALPANHKTSHRPLIEIRDSGSGEVILALRLIHDRRFRHLVRRRA